MSLSEFHENGFAPAAIAWLVWAVDERRWTLAALFAALVLSIKEDEAVILAVLGVGYTVISLRRHDRPAAIFAGCVVLAAGAVLALYFGVIQPATGGRWFVADFYLAHDADLPHGLETITGRLTFLLEVFVPLVFVPLRSRALWLAAPGLIEVLSSRWPVTYTMGTHYAGVWIAYVLAAFAVAVAGIARTNPPRALSLVRASLVVCVLNLTFASPTHWGHYLRVRNAHDAALDSLVALVPANAPVATYDEVYSHLGFDPNAQIGFSPSALPQYALFDERYDGAAWLRAYRPRLQEYVRAGRYVPVATADGATLYRRAN
jgi:uncharacterized membrane protein